MKFLFRISGIAKVESGGRWGWGDSVCLFVGGGGG